MFFLKRQFRVLRASPTRAGELMLINPTDTACDLNAAIARSLSASCGRGFKRHVKRILRNRHRGSLPLGQVMITDAGAHPTAKYVAHTAVAEPAGLPELRWVAAAYRNLWRAIDELDEAPQGVSLAMLALGGEIDELGVRIPTEVACRTLWDHLRDHQRTKVGDVTFYCFDLVDYLTTLDIVTSYYEVAPESLPAEIRRYVHSSPAMPSLWP